MFAYTHSVCVWVCVSVGGSHRHREAQTKRKISFTITLFPFTVYGRFVHPLNGNNHEHVRLIGRFLGRIWYRKEIKHVWYSAVYLAKVKE